MSRIVVQYEGGRVWSCDTNGIGSESASTVCAASGAIELISGSLVFSPQVMRWTKNEWGKPKNDCGDGYPWALSQYILLDEQQLIGAASITVDGMLAYTLDSGVLVPAGKTSCPSGDGMISEFATANHPGVDEYYKTMDSPETPYFF